MLHTWRPIKTMTLVLGHDKTLFLEFFILIFHRLSNLCYCNSGIRIKTLASFGAAYMTTNKNYDIGTWLRQNLFLRVFILIFDKLRNLWYCNSGIRINTLTSFGAAYMTTNKNYDIGTWLRQNHILWVLSYCKYLW